MHVFLGITCASGAPYAARLLEHVLGLRLADEQRVTELLDVRRPRHSVERLVAAGVVVHEHGALRLEDQQSHRLRQDGGATVPVYRTSQRATRRRIDCTLLPFSDRSAILNSMVQYSTTVDRAFAALADPTRRAVLERLGAGSATISELAEPFGMSLTGMKKHIRLLEEANLVATEKVGRARRCTLVPYAFEGISTWLQRLDRFAQVVERTKGAR
jgi:DNA-binding transcriptional ArsR family regulator